MDEDFDFLVMECTTCRLKFYAPDLKVSSLTNKLVCRNCLNFPGSKVTILKDKLVEKKKASPPKSQPLLPKKELSEETSLVLPAGYALYLCKNCQYSFARHEARFNKICPYCGRQEVKTTQRSKF